MAGPRPVTPRPRLPSPIDPDRRASAAPPVKITPAAKAGAPGQQKKAAGAKSAKSFAPRQQAARTPSYGGKGMDAKAIAGIVARSKAKYGRMPSQSAVKATYGRNVARAAKAKMAQVAKADKPGATSVEPNSTTATDANVKAHLAKLKAAAAAGMAEVTINGERWATNPETIAQTERNIARDEKTRRGSTHDYAVPRGAKEVNARELPNGASNPGYNPGVDIYGMTPAQQRLIASGDQVYDGPGSTRPGPKNKGYQNSLALLKGG